MASKVIDSGVSGKEPINDRILKTLDAIEKKINEESIKNLLKEYNIKNYLECIIFLKKRFSLIRKDLIGNSSLDSLYTELINCHNNLINISSTPQNAYTYLISSKDYISNACIRVNQFPTYPHESEELGWIIEDFKNKLLSLEKLIDNEKSDFVKIISELKNNGKIEKQKLTDLETQISQREAALKLLTEGFQKEAEAVKSTAKIQFKEVVEELRKEIKLEKEKIDGEIEFASEDIQTKLVDVQALVGAIGNVGATGNYQKIANQHKIEADRLRNYSIGILLVLSIILVYCIWDIKDPGVEWHKIAIRVFSVSILIYPAVYCARESSKHREQETINRKAELELASISPFIANLDDDVQQKIKEKLADKYFGNPLKANDSNEKTDLVPITAFEKITDQLVKVLKTKT